ncbi:MAG: hypothetical protein ACUVUC_06385 [Thermoguttaceae bacterium]
MSEPFDPYYRWLGIPPKDQPPNFYRLLALELFESDPEVIEAAADRQMGHLRTYQTGPHAQLSQKLLNEVAAARICLLNPQKKAQYDAWLRGQLAGTAPELPGSAGLGIDPELASLIGQPPEGVAPPLPSMTGAGWPSAALIGGVLAVITAALVLGIVLTMWPRGPGKEARQTGMAAAKLPPGDAAHPAQPEAKIKPAPNEQSSTTRQKQDQRVNSGWPAKKIPEPQRPPAGVEPEGPGGEEFGGAWPDFPEPPPAPGPPAIKVPVWAKQVVSAKAPAPASPPTIRPPPQKQPIPSKAEQDQARALILEVYQQDYDRAATPEDQQALARKLLSAAQQDGNEPPQRFVLLMLAKELAERARDGPTTFEAIDELDAGFQVDAVGMKAEVLEQGASAARSPPDHAAIVEAALPLIEQAAAQEDLALAARIARLSQTEAAKARNKELQAAVRAAAKQLQETRRALEQVAAAREVLKANPHDAQANLAVGQYLCFLREDWEAGLRHLALCGEPALRALAQKELAPPVAPEDLAGLGNQWWDLAEKEKPERQKPFRLRAAYWYRAALDGLPEGLEKQRIQKRLEEVAPLEAARTARQAAKGPFRAYEGTWIVAFDNGTGRRYLIQATGEVAWGENRGRLKRVNGDLLIDLPNGDLERIKLAGDGLEIEHFDRMFRYPNQVACLGKARRLEKDPKETAGRVFRQLQGWWIVKYANNTARAYAFDPKGNLLSYALDRKGAIDRSVQPKQGRANVRDGELLLEFQDNTLERLELQGTMLWIEQYRARADYPHTFALFGYGAKKVLRQILKH